MNIIPLWPEMPPDSSGFVPTLTPYKAQKDLRTGAAFIVCPGGGYGWHAPHEGGSVAEWLNTLGIDAFVLQYRLAPLHKHPEMIEDASGAIRYLRAQADTLEIDPNRIGILGFSAGGHLAGSATTIFDSDSRPDLSVLVYPVIDMSGPHTHTGSRDNLLGTDHTMELAKEMSLQSRVTPQTPPVFLVHSSDDDCVPIMNTLLMAEALTRNNIPFEMRIYDHGSHGYGMAEPGSSLNSWTTECADWLKRKGFAR